MDRGEPGLNASLIIDVNNDGQFNFGEPLVVSDVNGNYSFTGLPAGTHRVRQLIQGQFGWIATTPNPVDIVVSTSGAAFNVDSGNYLLAAVSGLKFHDMNSNGQLDLPVENGMSGFWIYVDLNNNGTLDGGEPNGLTNNLAEYRLDRLPAGTYHVREVQFPGWTQTTPDVLIDVFPNVSGQVFTDVDFGNTRNAITLISGQKFNDLDGDGIKEDGEPPLGYWPIYLDANRNDAYDVGEPLTFTNSINGVYSFHGVAPGSYRVREIQQPGWSQMTANPGDVVVTTDGETHLGIDFGNRRDPVTAITGRKFHDLNSDGLQQSGEPGLRYWPIYVDANDSGAYEAGESIMWTDWNGFYSFAGFAPGTYAIREIQLAGWTQTTADPADVIVTAVGETFTDIDFGNRGTGGNDGIDPPTDLELIKGSVRAVAGEQVTYTLTVTNRGPADSFGVILGDQLKAGLVFESATPSQGVCFGGQTVVCAVGPLAVGESASVTIVAHVQSWVVDEIENEACVYSTSGDTELVNNCDIERTPIDTRTDLELVKTADGLRAIAGRDLTYTLRVRNNGPSDSTNVTLERIAAGSFFRLGRLDPRQLHTGSHHGQHRRLRSGDRCQRRDGCRDARRPRRSVGA